MKPLHLIKVTTKPATATKPDMVKLQSLHFSKNKPIYLSYSDYDTTWNSLIAEAWLADNGFDIVGCANVDDCSYFVTSRFKPLIK